MRDHQEEEEKEKETANEETKRKRKSERSDTSSARPVMRDVGCGDKKYEKEAQKEREERIRRMSERRDFSNNKRVWSPIS